LIFNRHKSFGLQSGEEGLKMIRQERRMGFGAAGIPSNSSKKTRVVFTSEWHRELNMIEADNPHNDEYAMRRFGVRIDFRAALHV
jgi:hypothetical protein